MDQQFLVVGLNPTLQNTFTFELVALGQVNRVGRHRVDVAGKGGNTTRVLVQLGESATHLTFCGGRNGDLYRALSQADSIPVSAPSVDADVRFCHTLLDLSAHSATEIVEPGATVPQEMEAAVLNIYARALSSTHTVVIGGTKAPGFSGSLYAVMVEEASRAGVRTVLDIRGDDLRGCLPHRPTLIKINVSEFTQTFMPDQVVAEDAPPGVLPAGLEQSMMDLRSRHGADVILTNGRHPVLATSAAGVLQVVPEPVEPVNAIGSGDAFTAGVAAALHRGLPPREVVALGMECARKNVLTEKPGSLE